MVAHGSRRATSGRRNSPNRPAAAAGLVLRRMILFRHASCQGAGELLDRRRMEVSDVPERQLLRGRGAPRMARDLLAEWFGDRIDRGVLAEARLMVSELVSNAVVHGRGDVILRAELAADRLRVEVRDQGDGFAHQVPRVGHEKLHGRGLLIVDGAASRWGIAPGSTRVWFEIDRVGARRRPTE